MRPFFTTIRKSTIILVVIGTIAFLLLLKGVSQSKLLIQNTGFTYDSTSSVLKIKDNRSGKVYPVLLDEKIIIDKSISSPEGLLITGKYPVDISSNWYNSIQLTVSALNEKSAVSLTLEMTNKYKMNDPVFLEVLTPEEEEQFFVLPYAEGLLIPAVEQYPFNEFYMWGY